MTRRSVVDRIASALRPVAELDAKLSCHGIRAAELLAAHGVPIVGGAFYSAPALAAAMGVPLDDEADEAIDPVGVLTSVLSPGGVEIASAEKRRGWHLVLRAAGPPVQFFNEDLSHLWSDDERLGPVRVAGQPVQARLFHVKRRHSGSAAFVVSGVESAAPPTLVFFVLLQERRVWVSSSGVLAWLAEDARRKPHEHKLEHVRLAPSEKVGGQIRCWFPLGNNPFEVEVQLHDMEGKTVLPIANRSSSARSRPRRAREEEKP